MRENVILLNMSTLPGRKTLSHYHYRCNDSEEYRFDGVSQLEAGTKTIMSLLAEKNQKVDRIIIMATNKAQGKDDNDNYREENDAVKFYCDRISAYIQGKENNYEYMKNPISDTLKENARRTINNFFDGCNQKLEYDSLKSSLSKVIRDFVDQYKAELKKDVPDTVNENVNEFVAEEVYLSDMASFENMIKEYTEKYVSKYVLKSHLFFSKEKWLCGMYSVLRLRYENMRNENSHIKEILTAKIDKLNEYIEFLEKRTPEKISEFMKQYAYEKYCAKEDVQIRKARQIELQNVYDSVELNDNFFKLVSIEENVSSVQDITFWKVIEAIKSELNNEVNLYIDTQGGNRSYMTEATAIAELLKGYGVTLASRYGIKYEFGDYSSEVQEVSDNYKSYELVSALKNFKECGRGDSLNDYFKKYYPHDEKANLMTYIIKSASDAIQLCDVEQFENAINMFNILIQVSKAGNRESDDDITQIDMILKDIEKDYEELIGGNYFDQIKWCYNKKFYQQALTLIESKIPKLLVEKGILYYLDECDDDSDDYQSAINAWKALVKDIYDNRINELYKIKDISHYFIKELARSKDENMDIDAYIGRDINGICVKSLCSRQNQDKVRELLKKYFKICKKRNDLNHAKGGISINEIQKELERFINSYADMMSIVGNRRASIREITYYEICTSLGGKYEQEAIKERREKIRKEIDSTIDSVKNSRNNSSIYDSYVDVIIDNIKELDSEKGYIKGLLKIINRNSDESFEDKIIKVIKLSSVSDISEELKNKISKLFAKEYQTEVKNMIELINAMAVQNNEKELLKSVINAIVICYRCNNNTLSKEFIELVTDILKIDENKKAKFTEMLCQINSITEVDEIPEENNPDYSFIGKLRNKNLLSSSCGFDNYFETSPNGVKAHIKILNKCNSDVGINIVYDIISEKEAVKIEETVEESVTFPDSNRNENCTIAKAVSLGIKVTAKKASGVEMQLEKMNYDLEEEFNIVNELDVFAMSIEYYVNNGKSGDFDKLNKSIEHKIGEYDKQNTLFLIPDIYLEHTNAEKLVKWLAANDILFKKLGRNSENQLVVR